jgi:hypothetical protein
VRSGSAQEIVVGQQTFNSNRVFPNHRKAPFGFKSLSPLGTQLSNLAGNRQINPSKLDSSNKNSQTHPGNAQIANLGLGEGKNWLLEHQFQTHPKDSIFIFMLLNRWSQDEQKRLVPKLFVTWRLMREVVTRDLFILVY